MPSPKASRRPSSSRRCDGSGVGTPRATCSGVRSRPTSCSSADSCDPGDRCEDAPVITWDAGRLAALVQRLPDAVIAMDANGTIVWAGGEAELLLGHRADELVGRNAVDLIDPVDAQIAAAALQRTRDATGATQPWPFRLLDGEGASSWMEMAPTNLIDDPEVGAIVVTIRSLGSRDAGAAQARSIEELFRRAFDD